VHDCVIIGSGIAGLAAAWEVLQRGGRPLVLERDTRAGGVIRTEMVDGFVIDAGPDALLIQKPAAINLCHELGLGDRLLPTLTPRTAFVVRGRRLVPLPEGSTLGIPTSVKPFLTTGLFSWTAKLRMGMELFIPPRREDRDESIGSFMRRRFGEEAVAYLAEPLLAGIHAGDVNKLSMRSSFPRLMEAEKTSGSVLRALSALQTGAAPQGAFLSLPSGIEELVHALVVRFPAGTIRYGATATEISGRGPYVVRLQSDESIETRAVVVATPAWAASTMLAGVDQELSRLASEVRYVSSATIALGLQRDQVAHPLQGSGFVVPRVERHVLMAGSWVSSKWPHRAPSGAVLLRGFVGGATDEGVLQRSDQEIADAVFSEFATLLKISGRPALTRVYRWIRANPQHEVGHLDRMAAIDARLAMLPGLFVTGSGFRGTGLPDCVADGRATGAKAARLRHGFGEAGRVS
jgi:oxygen-dependent protoporphyrinogen oxidase